MESLIKAVRHENNERPEASASCDSQTPSRAGSTLTSCLVARGVCDLR